MSSIENDVNRFVLCGHSMGCVNALQLAIYMKTYDYALLDKCHVVGSAPFPSLYEECTFINQPNVCIFGLKTEETYDSFMKTKELNETHYFPFILLNDTDDDRVTYDLVNDLSEFNTIVDNLQRSDPLHQWYNYKNSLSILLDSL